MLFLKLAFRNIFRQRRRTLLTALTMGGGYALSSLSLSLSEGSYAHIIEILTKDQSGHVQIHHADYLDSPNFYETMTDVDKIGAVLDSSPDVISWSPRIIAGALAFAGTKSTGVSVRGVDPAREAATLRIRPQIATGRYLRGSGEALVGRVAADILGISPGSELILISQAADGSIANDLFTVVGIIGKDDASQSRMSVLLSLSDAQEFYALEGRVHEIALVGAHANEAREISEDVARDLRAKGLAGLAADPWQVVDEDFYRSMQADKKGNYVTLAIILAIVGLGVLNTVLMSTLERTREFGLLKALGTRPRRIFSLIMTETVLLSAMSMIVGLPIAFGANWFFAAKGIRLSTPVDVAGMTFDRILGEISLFTMGFPAIWILAIATLVACFPAVQAMRIVPVKAMRKV